MTLVRAPWLVSVKVDPIEEAAAEGCRHFLYEVFPVKRTFLFLAACLVAGITSACTLTTSDIEDALDLPEVTPEVKASFESAVSTVTDQVIDAAMEATESATVPSAPAYTKRALRRMADAAIAGQTVDVNASKTTEDGGTINVTGTVSASGTDESGNVNLNLKADWANLTVNDGKATQKTTGSETITGTMAWTIDTFTVNLNLKGSFTLGSENYAFNITMTMEGDKMVYTGTVNGQSVSGNVPTGGSGDEPDTAPGCFMTAQSQVCQGPVGSETCTQTSDTFCIEFTDAGWSDASMATYCVQGSAAVNTCTSAGRLGRCSLVMDANGLKWTRHEYDGYYTQADCEADGGTWQAN